MYLKEIKKTCLISLCLAMAFLFIGLFSGCQGRPSSALKKNLKNIPKRIKAAEKAIEKSRQVYTEFINNKKFDELKPAIAKKNPEKAFTQAQELLDMAARLYVLNVKPLLGKNRNDLAVKGPVELNKINAFIIDAENKSQYPLKKAKYLYDIFINIDNKYEQAVSNYNYIDKTIKNIESGLLIQAKTDFPEKREGINAKFASIAKLGKKSQNAMKRLNNEYNNLRNKRDADYAILAESVKDLNDYFSQIKMLQDTFSKDITSLSKSYTKILQDMKQTYSAVVKRESWYDDQNYFPPVITTFNCTVTREVFEFIETNTSETIAEIYPGWTGMKIRNFIGSTWKKLGINPMDNWPGQYRHNRAVFWFDSWEIKYLHKYTIVENNKKYDTDWVPVSEDIFMKNFEYLGMAILSKPLGVFEDEADTIASPPGMAFIGNKEYGRWEKDSNGNSFWSWYGKYALFSHLLFYSTRGPVRYSSWNTYNSRFKGRKPYFGTTARGGALYGTNGIYIKNSSRFKNRSFYRMGGIKRPAPSVRGAGSSVRGGGPKARGK